MIRINLLPFDKRRPERTPLPRFLAIVFGVTLSAGMIALLAYTYFGTLKTMEKQLAEKETELNNIKLDNSKSESVNVENKLLKGQVEALVQIEKMRKVMWYKQLDKLCTVIDKNNAWVTSMSGVMSGEKPLALKTTAGDFEYLYYMKFTTMVPGSQFESVAKFRTSLTDTFANFEISDAIKPIFYMTPMPPITPVQQPKFIEKMSLSFDTEMGHAYPKKKN